MSNIFSKCYSDITKVTSLNYKDRENPSKNEDKRKGFNLFDNSPIEIIQALYN
jgi:hypothetical protein